MEDLQSLVSIPRIWDSLHRVEERLLEASTADDPYLTKIAQHLLLAGCKRFRPLLALLAAEFGTAADGESLVVCGWADHGSAAMAMFPNRSVDQAAGLFRQIREGVQTRG